MDFDEIFLESYTLPQPLEKEEMDTLLQEAINGSSEAKDKLITHNIRLVLYEVSSKFQKVEYDKKDLVSIGILGLIKAVNTYDITKGFKFTTYAMRCIDNEILMFLRKLKKQQEVDSIDRAIYYDKDGNEIKLEDALSDDTDLIEKIENKEVQKIVRKIVDQLPDRDKEIIMLYFGFYDDIIYTQREISKKLKISRSYVSRLINSIVKRIGLQLAEMGVIELHAVSPNNNGKNVGARRIQTIYEYFSDFTREEIDEMLSILSDEEKGLITLRYGEDLDNPIKSKLSKEESNKFYRCLMPKMKRLLINPLSGNKKQPRKSKEKKGASPEVQPTNQNETIKKEKIIKLPAVSNKNESEIAKEVLAAPDERLVLQFQGELSVEKNDITKNDCIRIIELLRTPTFTQVMGMLTAKESVIMSLKLGYVDNKCFSTESIAQFLGIDESEVLETTRKVLLLYKKYINGFLDSIIEFAADSSDKGRLLSFNSNSKKEP